MTTTTTPTAEKVVKLPPPTKYKESELKLVWDAALEVEAWTGTRAQDKIAFERVTFEGYQERYTTWHDALAHFRDVTDSIPNDEDVVSVALRLSQIEGAPNILKGMDDRQRKLLGHAEYWTPYAQACTKLLDEDDDTVLLDAVAPSLTGLIAHINLANGDAKAKKNCEPPVWDEYGHGRRIDKKLATPVATGEALLAKVLAAATKLPANFLPGEYTIPEIAAIDDYTAAFMAASRAGVSKFDMTDRETGAALTA